MRTIHQPMCGVIPPHILDRIAEHPDDETRQGARSTIDQMHALIGERQSFAAIGIPVARVSGRKRRRVYDAGHQTVLPGTLVRSERKKASDEDPEVTEAYDGSGATHEFYRRVFGRDSIDGRGMRLDSTVHYGRGFDNAFWNGQQMIYGDGDGKIFGRFTACLDVIAHELTHGVTQHAAGLESKGESGALNEHLSDAFGIMAKQYTLGQTADDSDWLIGEGLFTTRVSGKAVRSMEKPGSAYDDPILGKDPQPCHMRDYVDTTDDNGGIHINSGIPNHAFYLAAVFIGGETWDALGSIWYEVLTKHLGPRSDFEDFARATTEVAGERYMFGGLVQEAVFEAWSRVGLEPRMPSRPTTNLAKGKE